MKEFSNYVELDTHKDTIVVAVADAMGGQARCFGEIANTPEAIRRMVKKLSPDGEIISFCLMALHNNPVSQAHLLNHTGYWTMESSRNRRIE